VPQFVSHDVQKIIGEMHNNLWPKFPVKEWEAGAETRPAATPAANPPTEASVVGGGCQQLEHGAGGDIRYGVLAMDPASARTRAAVDAWIRDAGDAVTVFVDMPSAEQNSGASSYKFEDLSPQCSGLGREKTICCKAIASLRAMHTANPSSSFYARVSDDAIVFPSHLANTLAQFNASHELLLGTVFVGVDLPPVWNAASEPHTAGGGLYVLSNPLLVKLLAAAPEFMQQCEHEDVSLGAFVRRRFGVLSTNIGGIVQEPRQSTAFPSLESVPSCSSLPTKPHATYHPVTNEWGYV
jgi:hypothetical protein